MLPNMEQAALYNAINFMLGTGQRDNAAGPIARTAVGSRINTLLCPSSPLPSGNINWNGGSTVPAPGNSYFGSCGSSLEYDGNQTGGPPNGVFQWRGQAIGVRDVTDGTSNTIAFGEFRIGDFQNTKISIPQDVGDAPGILPAGIKRNTATINMPAGWFASPGNIIAWLTTCKGTLSTPSTNKSFLGDTWAFGVLGHALGNFVMPPNPVYPNCIDQTASAGDFDRPGIIGASSFHAGGANVGMCDGSVRFLKSSTSQQIIWSLGSRAQGEVISADAY